MGSTTGEEGNWNLRRRPTLFLFVENWFCCYFAFFFPVFLLETEEGLVVWVGKDASTAEKTNALYYAQVSLLNEKENVKSIVMMAISRFSPDGGQ